MDTDTTSAATLERTGPQPADVGRPTGRWAALRSWTTRQWLIAGGGALLYLLVVGLPTDIVPNPVFGRAIPPTWWSWPALVLTAALAGLLAGTYVHAPSPPDTGDPDARRSVIGGLLTFFAVGCPVCNKLVLLALGSSGAIAWFEPVQPLLQIVALGLLGWAVDARLRSTLVCDAGRPARPRRSTLLDGRRP